MQTECQKELLHPESSQWLESSHFSHCGASLRKCFQEQIGQIPARYGQLKGSGLYKSVNNKYKYFGYANARTEYLEHSSDIKV